MTVQLKAIILYKVVVVFTSVDKIVKEDLSNQSYCVILKTGFFFIVNFNLANFRESVLQKQINYLVIALICLYVLFIIRLDGHHQFKWRLLNPCLVI